MAKNMAFKVGGLLVLLLVCSTGCKLFESTEMQDRIKVYKINLRHPNILPAWCADNVPVKADTVISTPIIITKYDTVEGATVYVDCDTVNGVVPVKCPDQVIKHDSVYIPYYITKVNTAAYDSLYRYLQDVQKDSYTKDGKIKAKNTFLWILTGVMALLVLTIVLLVKWKPKTILT